MKYQCTFCDLEFDTWEETKTCQEHRHTILKVLDELEKKKFLQQNEEKQKQLDSILKKVKLDENEDVLNELIELLSKTIKDDKPLIAQILVNLLSAYTDNPTNLWISERSSEGKSYPSVEIAKSFLKDHVIILGSATTQSFKYIPGDLVNEKFEPIQHHLEFLNERISEEKDSKKINEYKKRKNLLLLNSKKSIDLRNKSILFKEPPPHSLLEQLYSTLSHDQEYNVFLGVNKGTRGENKGETIVLRGYPSMLICSAKDDTQAKRWSETKSRFEIVSPNVSKKKYSEGMDLVFSKRGLPKFLFEEEVISEKEEERKKELVLKLIKLIRSSGGEVFNPFKDELARQFPQEVGYRFRQGDRFSTLVKIHCLSYRLQRPKLKYREHEIPMVALADLKWANQVSQDTESIPPYKIHWFKQVFLPAWKEKSVPLNLTIKQETLEEPKTEGQEKGIIRINDIVEYVKKQGSKTNSRQVREVFLNPLNDYGYIDKDHDPDNKTQYVYWPYRLKFENSQTPLNSLSPFNASCLESCLAKYRIERFELVCNTRKYDIKSIIPILLDGQNSFSTPESEPKIANGDEEMKGDERR